MINKSIISGLFFLFIFSFSAVVSGQKIKQSLSNEQNENPLGIPSPSQINSTETVCILLRHAEKGSAGNDPDLSAEGQKRAEELKQLLKNVHIDGVYSTPFKRTRQTVSPLAIEKGIMIHEYSPKESAQQFIDQILAENQGKVVVIVGHSNTIPEMVKILSHNAIDAKINENQFDTIFITKNSSGKGSISAFQKKFGTSTP